MALIFHFKCTLKCCLQFVSIWMSKIVLSGDGLRVSVWSVAKTKSQKDMS